MQIRPIGKLLPSWDDVLILGTAGQMHLKDLREV